MDKPISLEYKESDRSSRSRRKTDEHAYCATDTTALPSARPFLRAAICREGLCSWSLGEVWWDTTLRYLERLALGQPDRKSTRLNSSHRCISYAVFCLKKKQ